MRRAVIVLALLFFVGPQVSLACLWDYDTLNEERSQYPETHKLIVGHFIRHSDVYYRWRIVDRSQKSPGDRTPQDYDDIAVAYDKLGQHDHAIKTIEEKRFLWPDKFRYETEANLGTFLIHSGRFEEGLKHIDAAIQINPDAHFGREIYQKLLVEYIMAKRAVGIEGFPLNREHQKTIKPEALIHWQNYLDFVHQKLLPAAKDDTAGKALAGVQGMMRFGNFDSPILLEVLGDILKEQRAQMLAARAYLMASYRVDDPVAKKLYREKAEYALSNQYGIELADIEESLRSEIQEAQDFSRQIIEDERAWAAAGLNLDEQFQVKYYSQPRVSLAWADWFPLQRIVNPMSLLATTVNVAIVLLAVYVVRRIFFRRKAAAA